MQLAKDFNTSIISADSRQCYRELNIGVAKPSQAQLNEVPHYFINSHSIQEPVNAALYEQYALKSLDEIFSRQPIAIVVGGTGLYIKSLCEGVDEMPGIPESIRNQIRTQFYNKGIEWLQQEVQRVDPLYYTSGEVKNPHRLMRALEIITSTGQSIRHYQKGVKRERPFQLIKIGLNLPKEILHERINCRVDEMMAEGLVDEVKELQAFQHLKALQTVGYREIFDHLNGLSSLEAAVEFIKRNTRQYAKRQLTWFKRDADMHWMPPDADAAKAFIEKRLAEG